MKKSLLAPVALAVLGAFAGAAQAQSNVTMYGRIDVGLSHNTKSYSTNQETPFGDNMYLSPQNNTVAGAGAVTALTGAGLGASLLGFKGTEDLGTGTKIGFNAYSVLNQNSGMLASARGSLALNNRAGNESSGDGSCNGQFFCEYYAIIQMANAGTLTVGRQTTLMQDNIVASDIMTGAPAYSLTGFTGTFGGAGFTRESKWDNSIKWKNTFGGVDVGAQYRIGGSNQNTSTNAAAALSIGIKQASWGVTAVYEKINDAQSGGSECNFNTNPTNSLNMASCNVSATSIQSPATQSTLGIGTLSMIFADLQAWNIGGYFKPTDSLTAKGGYWRTIVSNPNNPSFDFAVNNADGFVLTGANWVNRYATNETQQYLYAGLQFDAAPNQRYYIAGYRYLLGAFQQMTVAAQNTAPYYHNGAATPTSLAAAGENVYSISTQYDLSKRTTLYGGVSHVALTGTVTGANVFGANFGGYANTSISMGLRHNF